MAGLVSPKISLFDLQMATFSLCPHMFLCACVLTCSCPKLCFFSYHVSHIELGPHLYDFLN